VPGLFGAAGARTGQTQGSPSCSAPVRERLAASASVKAPAPRVPTSRRWCSSTSPPAAST
jgi:hypothetical protein